MQVAGIREERTIAVESVFWQAVSFVRRRPVAFLIVCLIVLIPCFWQPRIQAGDLGSHVYNAWLVQLVEQGQAPGLWIARQWNNVLFDIVLVRLGAVVGLALAEKLAVAAAVLIFVWGSLAFIFVVSRKKPWFLVPVVFMLAYGWTFHIGFFNFYLSVGLSFCVLALVWRGCRWDYLLVILLAPLVWLAHPLGFLWLAAAGAYIQLSKWVGPDKQIFLMLLGVAAALALRLYVAAHYAVRWWGEWFYINGADQLILFGRRYFFLSIALFGCSVAFLLFDWIKEGNIRSRRMISVPVQLYLLLQYGLALSPDTIVFPQYAAPATCVVVRFTIVAAVLGCTVLASVRPRALYFGIFGVLAVVFFSFLYKDTAKLNVMERQVRREVEKLPPGSRVLSSISRPQGSRIFIHHIVDRACIGHCFSYGNYEPSSLQFRLRARPDNGIVTASSEDADALWTGTYALRPGESPMYQIYQCGVTQTDICVRKLHVSMSSGNNSNAGSQ